MDTLGTIIIYTVTVTLGCVFYGIASNVDDKKTRYGYYIAITSLISLLPAFRNTTGTDSPMYKSLFLFDVPGVNRWVKIEKGYMFLNDFFRKWAPYQLFLFFVAFCTLFLIILGLDKYRGSINFYLSSFILLSTLYFQSFNIMRQCLAVSICFYAIICYVDNKRIRSLVLILIASTIHMSALICLFIFITNILYNRKYKTFFTILTFLVVGYLVLHRQTLGQLVYAFTGSNYYSGYITREAFTGGSFINFYLKNMFILIIACLYYPMYRKKDGMNVLFVLMIVGYILSSLGAVLDTQVGRMGLYFTVLSMVILGYCAANDLKIGQLIISRQIILLSLFIYYILIFAMSYLISGYGEIVPYLFG